MVSIRTKRNDLGLLRRRRANNSFNNERLGLLVLTFVFVGYLVYSVYSQVKDMVIAQKHNNMVRKTDQQQFFAGQSHPSLQLERPEALENIDFLDVEAADIRKLLHCDVLLQNHRAGFQNGSYMYGVKTEGGEVLFEKDETNETHDTLPDTSSADSERQIQRNASRRRLSLEDGHDPPMDGIMEDDYGNMDDQAEISAAHLFCLAAYSSTDDIVAFWKDKVQCPVLSDVDTHKGLLDLWSTARSEILIPILLTKTLSISTERYISLAGKSLQVWAPPRDEGTTFMLTNLQKQFESKERIGNLHENLGKDRLFVDVGSGLGYTAMAVSILYPGTTIVSVEAAPTNWLLQQLNWRCNKDLDPPKAILNDGVGPSTQTSQVAKFIWRPTSTSSTRAWSLNMEDAHKDSNHDQDFEFSVKLLPWHKLLLEAEIMDQTIDVLNLDCEGCEYNLIPSLVEMEFQAIRSILGELHWSYIPKLKRPSSKRAKNTHSRLCGHEDFAKEAIECCDFPHTPVRSTVSGEVLIQDTEQQPPIRVTVQDLIGEALCPGFEKWAEKTDLNNIESDWAWFQVESMNRIG